MYFARSKIIMAIALVSFSGTLAHADLPNIRYVQNTDRQQPMPVVAIDNVCGWPNLSMLSDGTIIATIFNKPSHAYVEGDLECWGSTDGGQNWQMRGTPAAHEPGTNRCNFATGVADNGDLIVLSSGWSLTYPKSILTPWLCRSSDGGFTWTIDKDSLPQEMPSGIVPIPFGNIRKGADGTMRVVTSNQQYGSPAYVYRSRDDGFTWGEPVPLNEFGAPTETPLLHLGEGRWLAAGRTDGLQLFASDDDGMTWEDRGPVTDPQQHPGNLLRLQDGKILLSYGNRVGDNKGVEVIWSDNEGVSWSDPIRVLDWTGDGGYPSSVQRADGQVVTAYYAQEIEGHDRYHVGTVTWDPTVSLASIFGDEIFYQEIFPSDGHTVGDPGVAGWTAYSGAVAGSTTMSISGTNGMPQDTLPINSDPQVAGIEQGWSYFTGGGAGGSFTWTDEFTDSSLLGLTDITEVGTVSWYQGHKNATMETRAALKVGEQWYLSSNGFTNVPMASGNSMYADAELKEVDLATELWYPLVFDAGLEMSLDMTGAPTSLPSGNLTGAGLYFADTGGAADTCRFDTFAIADVLVPSVPGDANGDNKVDGSDVTILAGNWQVGVDGAVEATWAMGDFNGDKKVDGSDVTILAGNWQYGVTATAASVPEPATLCGLVALCFGGLFLRRRR